jgi:copper chaperone CopZ
MTCANCERHVVEALTAVPGVADVDVSLANGAARVQWLGTDADVEALVSAIDEAGYVARVESPAGN